MNPKIFAVVVAFNPDENLPNLIQVLSPQVDVLVLVKNSRIPSLRCPPNVWIVGNENNHGLGLGLNSGIRAALEAGARWIVLFDQDSIPSEHFVKKSFESLEQYSSSLTVNDFIFGAGFSEKPFDLTNLHESKIDPVPTVFTSGSLFPVSVIEKIGFMNEEFFIDQIDHEFCLRAKRAGIPVLKGKEPFFQHTVGNPNPKRFLLWNVHPSNHSSLRWFFGARNLLWNFKLNGPSPVMFFVQELYSQLNRLLKVWFFESQKISKTFSFLRGIFFGLFKPAPHAPRILDSVR